MGNEKIWRVNKTLSPQYYLFAWVITIERRSILEIDTTKCRCLFFLYLSWLVLLRYLPLVSDWKHCLNHMTVTLHFYLEITPWTLFVTWSEAENLWTITKPVYDIDHYLKTRIRSFFILFLRTFIVTWASDRGVSTAYCWSSSARIITIGCISLYEAPRLLVISAFRSHCSD